MARNEEKQLARLNRFYLQKQKEEELKKRPPRPKLESLTTHEDIKKWLPSITRDIDFYVKQMEVPCYQDKQIEEFDRRIGHLKGEYKAYLRKLRELNPDDKLIPWTDRPYAMKRKKLLSSPEVIGFKENDDSDHDCDKNPSPAQLLPTSFIPLSTPVLNNDEKNLQNFGYKKPVVASCPDLSNESTDMNKPLQFRFAPVMKTVTSNDKINNNAENDVQTYNPRESYKSIGVLNLPYSDSSSSDDET